MSLKQLNYTNRFQKLGPHFYSEVSPTDLHKPYWIHIDFDAANRLGVSQDTWNDNDTLANFSGQQALADQPTLAMVYAGHQFGGYSSQLDD